MDRGIFCRIARTTWAALAIIVISFTNPSHAWAAVVDHGGADWILSENATASGVHTNIHDFTVQRNVTLSIDQYNGTNDGTGTLEVHCENFALGKGASINADGAGYSGGSGGGGRGSRVLEPEIYIYIYFAGGDPGKVPYEGFPSMIGGKGGYGGAGKGGVGDGPFGAIIGNGGYAISGGNGDSSTDESVLMGSGGAGHPGDISKYSGGAAGGSGGGSISVSSNKLNLLAASKISANGSLGMEGEFSDYRYGGDGGDAGPINDNPLSYSGAGGGIMLKSESQALIDSSVQISTLGGGGGNSANGGTLKFFSPGIDSQEPQFNILANRVLARDVISPSAIATALGAPELTFRSEGSAKWFAVDDNPDYVQSGDIGDNQESALLTYIQGPASIQFDWKVSSEALYDTLSFEIDGVQKASLNAEGAALDWASLFYMLPKGMHTIRWIYKKDFSGSEGADAGYVRNIKFAQGEWLSDNLSRRVRSGMAYDSLRDRMVLFGGNGSAAHEDTYVSDNATSWTQVTSDGPPARATTALVYDAQRDRVVLFGGMGDNTIPLGDTWEFDGTVWTQRSPATSPPARIDHCMAYDPIGGITYLFGGNLGTATQCLNDLWSWDGEEWTRLSAGGSDPALPPARSGAAMAFDTARGALVLTGGANGTNTFAADAIKTWEWDGAQWRLASTVGPNARQGALLLFNPSTNKSFLMGGYPTVINGPSATDMWEWDGAKWFQNHSNYTIGKQAYYGGAFDTQRNRIVVFGGFNSGDTWVYENGGWARNSEEAGPLELANGSAAYDRDRHRIFALLSFYDAQTYEYYDHNWHSSNVAGQPGLNLPSVMEYDPVNKLFLVLLDSQNSYTFDPATATWTKLAQLSPVNLAGDGSLSYNPDRNSIVFATPSTTTGTRTAEWSGTWSGTTDNSGVGVKTNITYDANCASTIAYGSGLLRKYPGFTEAPGTVAFSQSARGRLGFDPATSYDIVLGAQSTTVSPIQGNYRLVVRKCDGGLRPIPATGPVYSNRVQMMVDTDRNCALAVGGNVGSEVWRWKTSVQPGPNAQSTQEILLGTMHDFDLLFEDANGDGIIDAGDLTAAP
ncbi:MAG: kelch repeat-containing protein [Candidatus Sumerlaeota bacterium]